MSTSPVVIVTSAAYDRGQADRPCSYDRHDVAGAHRPVQDPDFVGGREDVGEHQDFLVGRTGRESDLLHPHLGRTERLMTEDPPILTSGTSPVKLWRSVPQIVTASTRTIASVLSSRAGR